MFAAEGQIVQVKFTLTTEMPTWRLGLWDTREEAEAFMKESGLTAGTAVTPVFFDCLLRRNGRCAPVARVYRGSVS